MKEIQETGLYVARVVHREDAHYYIETDQIRCDLTATAIFFRYPLKNVLKSDGKEPYFDTLKQAKDNLNDYVPDFMSDGDWKVLWRNVDEHEEVYYINEKQFESFRVFFSGEKGKDISLDELTDEVFARFGSKAKETE